MKFKCRWTNKGAGGNTLETGKCQNVLFGGDLNGKKRKRLNQI